MFGGLRRGSTGARVFPRTLSRSAKAGCAGPVSPSTSLTIDLGAGADDRFTCRRYYAPAQTPLTIVFTNEVFAGHEPTRANLWVYPRGDPYVPAHPNQQGLHSYSPRYNVATSPLIEAPKSTTIRVRPLTAGTYDIISIGLPNAHASLVVGGPTPSATITGTLEAVGGPANVAPTPLTGEVRFEMRGGRGTTYTAVTGRSGRFSLPVEPGVHSGSGSRPDFNSGQGSCRPSRPVRARSRHTVHVEVICQER